MGTEEVVSRQGRGETTGLVVGDSGFLAYAIGWLGLSLTEMGKTEEPLGKGHREFRLGA